MSKAKVEMKPLPKRFYKRAAFDPVHEGFVATLDGKNIRTPQQQLLQHKSEKLLQQIAAEWDAQKEAIDTDSMPLTRLLNIALDRTAADRAALLAEIANYCETDLVFYHVSDAENTTGSHSPLEGESKRFSVSVGGKSAKKSPHQNAQEHFGSPSRGEREQALPLAAQFDAATAELAALQLQHFAPVLAWVQQTYGLQFNVTEGVMPVAQPVGSLQKLAEIFAAANDHELAALSMLVPILGSALLTLAVWKGAIDIEAALIAARLDEFVQEKKWGTDAETKAKWQGKCRDARAAAFFLTCN